MQIVLALPDGTTWHLLETQQECDQEGVVMHHHISMAFRMESLKVRAEYRESIIPEFQTQDAEERYEFRHRSLFFSLRNAEGKSLVSGMLPRGTAVGDPVFVAYSNYDPYVEHEVAIVELGKLYGFDLSCGQAYPKGFPYDALRGKAPPPERERIPPPAGYNMRDGMS